MTSWRRSRCCRCCCLCDAAIRTHNLHACTIFTLLLSLRPYASREHATLLQVAVAAKTNTNDVSLLRLVNKFVRQVHGGRVTSCKVGPPLCVATLHCASRAVCAAYMASVRDQRVRVCAPLAVLSSLQRIAAPWR
jgi:hypothetical protein